MYSTEARSLVSASKLETSVQVWEMNGQRTRMIRVDQKSTLLPIAEFRAYARGTMRAEHTTGREKHRDRSGKPPDKAGINAVSLEGTMDAR